MFQHKFINFKGWCTNFGIAEYFWVKNGFKDGIAQTRVLESGRDSGESIGIEYKETNRNRIQKWNHQRAFLSLYYFIMTIPSHQIFKLNRSAFCTDTSSNLVDRDSSLYTLMKNIRLVVVESIPFLDACTNGLSESPESKSQHES
ncbi:hypothetical protein CEXT_240941 [Caerostris extrusa]|uniref:Uncharacterized protein n=1 Tax=Caerostris extrusa TaxID=172846 RepID=A0AAV4XHC0_CAEEX|nr:hypothetical protein CEXT_240941 [Caerostris extrusa]